MSVRRAGTLVKALAGVGVGGYVVYVWRVQSRTPPPYVPRVMPRNDDLTRDVPKLRVVYRLFTLLVIMIPVVLTWPLISRNERVRQKWYRLVKRILEKLGPAFIKLGQWSVTRRDLFPPDACAIFSELHMQVKPHPFGYTRKVIREDFGRELEEMFEEFDHEPTGSGSIAQVYHAKLKGTHESVAVKVLHPNVKENIKVDFFCLKLLSRLVHPFYKWMNIPGLADQFAENLSLQVDMRFEKYNGKIFHENFDKCKSIQNPLPLDELVTERVKVETWVEGVPVSRFFCTDVIVPGEFHRSSDLQRKLANIGVAVFMQMMVTDNWFHADLHPGNILVSFKDGNQNKPVISLVDTGIVQTLTEEQHQVVLMLMSGVFLKDGRKSGEALLRMGSNSKPEESAVFLDDMEKLFAHLYPPKPKDFKYYIRLLRLLEIYENMERRFGIGGQSVKTGKANKMVQGVFDMVRKHHLVLDPTYVQLLVTAMMMEQVANSIDPDCDVIFQCEPWLTAGFFGYRRKAW